MRIFKNIVYIILFVALLCCFWYLTLNVFFGIFVDKNHDYIVNGLGSFFGAFWAFLFMLVADFVKNKIERVKTHVNSLVKLEYKLNKILAINSDNLFEVKKFTETLEEKNFISDVKFIQTEELDDLLIDFLNIDFINDVFSVNIDIYKTNKSFDQIQRGLDEIKLKIVKDDLKNKILPSFKYMHNFLEKLDKDIEILMAKTQALIYFDQPTNNKMFINYFNNKSKRRFESKWKEKLEQIKKDREKTYQKSLNNINELSGNL